MAFAVLMRHCPNVCWTSNWGSDGLAPLSIIINLPVVGNWLALTKTLGSHQWIFNDWTDPFNEWRGWTSQPLFKAWSTRVSSRYARCEGDVEFVLQTGLMSVIRKRFALTISWPHISKRILLGYSLPKEVYTIFLHIFTTTDAPLPCTVLPVGTCWHRQKLDLTLWMTMSWDVLGLSMSVHWGYLSPQKIWEIMRMGGFGSRVNGSVMLRTRCPAICNMPCQTRQGSVC